MSDLSTGAAVAEDAEPTEPEYEYIVRAVSGDGSLIDETRPRHGLLEWAATFGTEFLRARHPDLVAAQLRRPAWSGGPWEVVEACAGDPASTPAICEPFLRTAVCPAVNLVVLGDDAPGTRVPDPPPDPERADPVRLHVDQALYLLRGGKYPQDDEGDPATLRDRRAAWHLAHALDGLHRLVAGSQCPASPPCPAGPP